MRTVVFLTCAALIACTASSEEVAPHEDDDTAIFFPTGAAVSPDDSVLFVANANSELRYDSGSIVVIDLAKADQVATDWTGSKTVAAGCETDPDHRETLICSEEHFIIPGAGARVGNFATSIAVQDFKNGGGLRLIVPTRGDPSVAWIDWDGNARRLSCNPGAEGFSLCDADHRLAYVHNDPNVGLLPDEPFDAFAGKDFAIVSHLTTGAVTLLDSPPGGNATIADVVNGLFGPDPLTGLRGSTGVAGRGDSGLVYVGSRSEDRIQTLTVGRPVNAAPPYIVPDNYFFLDFIGANSGSSTDTRGMRFSASGDRLYLINRRPPSLQVFDTSLGPTGFPRNKGIAATDLCREASTLAILDAGDGDRAYISCFQDGEIYIVDPRGQATVEDIVTVGRGPYAVAAAPTRKKVYVTNFLEDTVAVIDVDPTSATYNRVVLRIGVPRSP